jgi:hypothetical protein
VSFPWLPYHNTLVTFTLAGSSMLAFGTVVHLPHFTIICMHICHLCWTTRLYKAGAIYFSFFDPIMWLRIWYMIDAHYFLVTTALRQTGLFSIFHQRNYTLGSRIRT